MAQKQAQDKLADVDDQVQQSVTQGMAEEKKSKELLLFDSVRDQLSDLLRHSTTTLADYCLQEGLITHGVDAKAADELAHLNTGPEKTAMLLKILTKKMDKKMGNAGTIWAHFMASIEDMEDVHKYLSNEKATKTDCKEVDILTTNRKRIVDTLQFNLLSVAGKLLQNSVLNPVEYRLVTDSQAKHNDLLMIELLDSIRLAIKTNEKNMKVFLENVLEEIGGPARDISKQLMKKLNSDLPPNPLGNDQNEKMDIN